MTRARLKMTRLLVLCLQTVLLSARKIAYKDSTIFSYLPITLNNNEQGFLLGLNNSIALVSLDGAIKSEYSDFQNLV